MLRDATHRDGDTWAIHLLDLRTRGLVPDYTIADAGAGLRAGQLTAWSDVPCHGDVFHIQQQSETVANLWARTARSARSRCEAVKARLANPRRRCDDQQLEAELSAQREQAAHAHRLAEDLRTLTQWLERDVLSLAGPAHTTRQELFDFIVAELASREGADPSHIGTLRGALQNQRDVLLAFAKVLDGKLETIARTQDVPLHLVQSTCLLHRKRSTSTAFWQGWNRLHTAIGRKFHTLWHAVSQAMANTPRSSSLIENLNSRLRQYLTLRCHLDSGQSWLGLLSFFFNHRRFARSWCEARAGKSPREVMTAAAHPHWLTLLGLGELPPLRA